MTDSDETIRAQFEVVRVQIMADGAVRVVLEASEHRTDLLQTLADAKRAGAILETVMLPVSMQAEKRNSIYG